jgi:hypothetical protein
MNSRDLADAVAEVVTDAQARILGVGHDQYAEGDTQKFETMPLADLLTYFEEELLDQINYSVMNIIRFRRMRQELDRAASREVVRQARGEQ